jgi:hypothetical protein
MSEKPAKLWPMLALTAAIAVVVAVTVSGANPTAGAKIERQAQSKY